MSRQSIFYLTPDGSLPSRCDAVFSPMPVFGDGPIPHLSGIEGQLAMHLDGRLLINFPPKTVAAGLHFIAFVFQPVIITAAADTQGFAHDADTVLMFILIDKPKFHRRGFEKQL